MERNAAKRNIRRLTFRLGCPRPQIWLGSLVVLAGCWSEPPATSNETNDPRTPPSRASATPADQASGPPAEATAFDDSSARANSGDRGTGRSLNAEPVEIGFEDIQLPIQADIVFRPFMLTDRVRDLDGQRIRINGYMLPDTKTKGIKQFVLLKNTECKFGPGGQADHLLNVLMVDGETAKYRDDPITIEGVLKVNPFQGPDGNTWSIYDLTCDRVEGYHPRR